MRLSWKVYLLLGVVLLISYLTASSLPTTDVLRGILSLPGVLSLLAVIYQLIRDHAAFERELEIRRQDQVFTLSVTSHMAELAFDKSVAFSEEYLRKVYEGLTEIFAHGPDGQASKLSGELQLIRRNHAPWVTFEIARALEPFEKALSTISAQAALLNSGAVTDPSHPMIDNMSNLLYSVLGMQDQNAGVDPSLAPERLVGHLQNLLGIGELTHLRRRILDAATSNLDAARDGYIQSVRVAS